ncbi:TIGR03086 family metal-binding protein [Frankia sp. CiP3]|uniref:TIGR03086 family metal-binding protein n=1 Tax=Frankia sp. CiP3 TaxID=2880971 RepID=UPI001EF59C59|nr:TIGR03086 family metal-binding protein [Frankia sp. CiP3]
MTPTASDMPGQVTGASDADGGAMLEGVLAGARALIAAVATDALQRPTPCPNFDVQALVEHMVSWLRMFDAGFAGRSGADPKTLGPGPEPATDFADVAASVLRRWRAGGPQAMVALTGPPTPGPFVYRMMVGEYVVHGWDLAAATGQPLPFSAEEAEFALAALRDMLQPQYRGGAFGPEVGVPANAAAVDRLVAFTGRDPRWIPLVHAV